MQIGISTSCFYPMITENTLQHIAELGFKHIEVFVNSPSESTVSYAKNFKKQAQSYGLNIVAFHPFSSFAETYCLFGSYEPRRKDFYEIYRGYFEAAAAMGASVFNFHGCRSDWPMEVSRYCEIYQDLYHIANKEGIRFSQENVNRHYAGHVSFIKDMNSILKDDLYFTLDIKQAKRCGEDPCCVRDAMGERLIHLHASDYLEDGACALPGQGLCHYEDILNDHLRSDAVSKVIEVYSGNYSELSELKMAAQYMNKL